MKKPNTYILRIIGSHPDKLALERLAAYLAELAKLMGEKECVHFDRLVKGSAALRAWAEPGVADEVAKRVRLTAERHAKAPKEAIGALERINELLVQDGRRGELKSPAGAVIYAFPGGRKANLAKEVIVDQDSSITGQVIKIGGRDDTIPVLVKDPDGREYKCTIVGPQLAKEIAAHYLGAQIELSGKGRWRRSPSGTWELINLNVKSWAPLSDDWDEALSTMESLGLGWSNILNIEEHLVGLRKGQ